MSNEPSNLSAPDKRQLDMLAHRIQELELRVDTLELDQEVLWDDMQERQKRSEMFPQELQTA